MSGGKPEPNTLHQTLRGRLSRFDETFLRALTAVLLALDRIDLLPGDLIEHMVQYILGSDSMNIALMTTEEVHRWPMSLLAVVDGRGYATQFNSPPALSTHVLPGDNLPHYAEDNLPHCVFGGGTMGGMFFGDIGVAQGKMMGQGGRNIFKSKNFVQGPFISGCARKRQVVKRPFWRICPRGHGGEWRDGNDRQQIHISLLAPRVNTKGSYLVRTNTNVRDTPGDRQEVLILVFTDGVARLTSTPYTWFIGSL
eukprot:gene21566-1219_t